MVQEPVSIVYLSPANAQFTLLRLQLESKLIARPVVGIRLLALETP